MGRTAASYVLIQAIACRDGCPRLRRAHPLFKGIHRDTEESKSKNHQVDSTMKHILPLLTFLLLAPIIATQAAEQKQKQLESAEPDQLVEYKKVGDTVLHLHVFNPPGHKASDKTPAIIFFFGGGWAVETPSQFYKQAAK